ncbi:MAG: ATP-binding protein [Candidatus Krumholzibacteria bacterium]|nr:ATP-binding protein [Candidatus Krumholzibacteria bacterium]MDH4338570.1 ATP-binding protein [Candidatus Krumholzibacteria bacterium]MDH5271319.1 ATP-binding protein [Candidatus Krumholzibacteria bacterium]
MATNPCHCGYHGSKVKQCKCSPLQRESYIGKISGPLLDRIAIHLTVQAVDVEMWKSTATGMNSATMRDMVTRARAIQAERFNDVDGVDCNARLPDGLFATFCAMDSSAEALFVKAQKSLMVSARARGHIVRVARTIADLDGSEAITVRHLMEAVGYRGDTPVE